MPKKRKAHDIPPLSHYWSPPEELVDGGVGHPWACLATTYEFNAPHFETDLLPRFLGLKFDHTENEPSFLVEREEALSLVRVAVLVDQERFDSTQTTMSWDQILVHVPGGILHAKITLLAWERLVRVIIGSANLTRAGYRKNRELFAALDFWDAPHSVPLRVLWDALDLLGVILQLSRVVPGARERAEETIDLIRDASNAWDSAPTDFTPHERPRVAVVATHPPAGSAAARSALEELLGLWRNRRAAHITVVTPFVGQTDKEQGNDVVVEKLKEIPQTRDCQGWLVVREQPRLSHDEKPRVPLPLTFGQSWQSAFGGRGGARVLTIPLCVEGKEDRNRELHSKAVAIENDTDAGLMIGSSNFTPRGMGLGTHNMEVDLVFEDRCDEKRGKMALVDRLALPRLWEEGIPPMDIVWEDPPEPAEDEPEASVPLPRFFAWAAYSQKTGELRLGLDDRHDEPATWRVRLPGAKTGELPPLFTQELRQPDPEADVLIHVFQPGTRSVSVVALAIEWTDKKGETHLGRLGVCVESKEDLLPPEEYRKLGADAIIECLISGKSPSQWYDQKQIGAERESRTEAGIESLRAVDTSTFLLYRVRRFGRALIGMCNRIDQTVAHVDALRYRLLRDPFGPVSLAKTITAAADERDAGWCVRLEDEHRVYLLTEIRLAMAHLRQRFVKQTRGKDRRAIKVLFDEVLQNLDSSIDLLISRCEGGVPQNLATYVADVRDLSGPRKRKIAGEV